MALTCHRRAAASLSYDALFERCGLPLAKYVPVTPSTFGEDASSIDVAALFDAADGRLLAFAGLLEALLTFDFGTAVVDNEISLMLKRVARGLEFSEANLALEEIRAVGPGGMFMDTEFTRERMKTTALLPEIADRETRQAWSKKGGLDTAARALLKARKILESDCPSLFSPEVEARIRQRFQGLVAGEFKPLSGS